MTDKNLASYKSHALTMQACPNLTSAQLYWLEILYDCLSQNTIVYNILFKKNISNLLAGDSNIDKDQLIDQILKDHFRYKLFVNSFIVMGLSMVLCKGIFDSFQYLSCFEPINLMLVTLVGLCLLMAISKMASDYTSASNQLSIIDGHRADVYGLYQK